jgi:hypothetical protein
MKAIKYMLWICAGVMFVTLVPPAWGYLNNGFETDYVYTMTTAGRITARSEATGGNMGDVRTDALYRSLTFTGSGTNNAQLFVGGVSASSGATDIVITELSPTGTVLKQKNLSTLLGSQPGSGSGIDFGSIRYNRFRNSLIVSANPNMNAAVSKAGMAWEIDLGLNTVLNTYQGMMVTDRGVYVGVNDRTGAMYMTSRSQGDMIAFDLLNPSTPYTTLINHLTIGDANWTLPKGVMYRDARLLTNGVPSTDDTVVICLNNNTNSAAMNEYYLDTVAHPMVNGNLALKGIPCYGWNPWNGQQDKVSGALWYGNYANYVTTLRADDTRQSFSTGGWLDAASPAPEPTSLILLGIGGLGLLIRRRAI